MKPRFALLANRIGGSASTHNRRGITILADGARALGLTGILENARATQTITAINYHWVSERDAESFEAQLAWLAAHFECLGEPELGDFIAGRRILAKPGLVVTFDDGYRNNLTTASPLLVKHGIRAWFFVIANACLRHDKAFRVPIRNVGDPRDLMTLPELLELKSIGHAIGCHTATHENLGRCPAEDLVRQVVVARQDLERGLGQPVSAFAFPYGTADSFTAESIAMVHGTYSFVFHSFPTGGQHANGGAIGRYHMEPYWSVPEMRLRLTGLWAMKYRSSMKRYARLKSRADQQDTQRSRDCTGKSDDTSH